MNSMKKMGYYDVIVLDYIYYRSVNALWIIHLNSYKSEEAWIII